MERLPLRIDHDLAGILSLSTAELEICQSHPAELPSVRFVLPLAAAARVRMLLRVHSRTGIPLASASIDVNPGDRVLESSPITLLAMEGYMHLTRGERQVVERRVWSRRAFATASAT
jgi:hypothetical protein